MEGLIRMNEVDHHPIFYHVCVLNYAMQIPYSLKMV
jgi:hypothetical protein